VFQYGTGKPSEQCLKRFCAGRIGLVRLSTKTGRCRRPALNCSQCRFRLALENCLNSPVGEIPTYATVARSEVPAWPIATESRDTEVVGLRERVLRDLRNEGYTFREIAQLLGISRQRANQIEKRIRRRAVQGDRPINAGRQQGIRVRPITSEEFANRITAINKCYQDRFETILRGSYRTRQSRNERVCKTSSTCLFGKIWPLIQSYQGKSFSLSKFINDFPALSDEPYLPQMLCRLRGTGFLLNLGRIRIKGQCVPEILVAEAPLEHRAKRAVETIARSWSKKLQELARSYRPTRPARSIDEVRNHIARQLIHDGCSEPEIDAIFLTPGNITKNAPCDSV
jgi:transcriptional regulator with XRE-family HTH domain